MHESARKETSPPSNPVPPNTQAAPSPKTSEATAETLIPPPQQATADGDTLIPSVPFGPSSDGLSGPALAGAPVETPGAAGYEILGELGRGGMGVVYKARQTKLKRLVALKMILGGTHAGGQELARFRSEAEAVARLQHPNIVQVYEVGERDGCPFFSLEYIDGGSLAGKLDGTPQQPRAAAKLVETLARAMQSAHQHGIIHRDLKPANVLLTADGIPKITDFGLAKQLDTESSQTQSGAIMGTPSYMAPEQAEGRIKEIGTAADVYALGAILYELLGGRPPFKGATVVDTLEQVRSQEPVSPRRLQPGLARDLETICLKCLHKDPARRYASALDLADDLRRFLEDKPIVARPVGAADRAWRWCRRNPVLAGLVAACILALVGGTTVSAFFAVRANDSARRADDKATLAEANADKARRLAAFAGKQRDLALDSFNTLLVEVHEKLGDTTEMRQLKDRLLETATKGLERLSEGTQEEVGADRGLAEARLRLANSFFKIGNLTAARKEYEAARKVLDAVVKDQPDDRRARMLWARTTSDLGNLVAQNDQAAARQLAGTALDAAESLHRADPADAEASELLVDACQRLGSIHLVAGEFAEATRLTRRALELTETLEKAKPGDADCQLAVAEAHRYLGNIRMKAGATREARAEYQTATDLARAVSAKNPAHSQAKLRCALNLTSVAEVAEKLDDAAGALTAYRQAYDLEQEILADAPYTGLLQVMLAATSAKLSELNLKAGDKGLARQYVVQTLWSMRKGTVEDPSNTAFQIALRDAHKLAAEISLAWEGKIAGRNHYRQALALTRKLADADAKNTDHRRELLDLHRKLGDLDLGLEHRSAARDHFQQALAFARDFAATDPKSEEAGLVAGLEKLREKARAGDERFRSNTLGVDLVLIPAGKFQMGGDEEAKTVAEVFKEVIAPYHAEHPRHEVVISRRFLLGATEVTRGQFRAFVKATGYQTDAEKDGKGIGAFNPTSGTAGRQWDDWQIKGNLYMTDDHPVIGVSWNDTIAFCAWLSKKEGKKYRLPTEAEWEYACRAGTTTRYWTGDNPESLLRGANVPDESFKEVNGNVSYATLKGRDGFSGLAPVGEFAANPFGLFDMHGNVWEWCQDGWDAKFYGQKMRDDPLAPVDRPAHVIRGGCFM